MAPLFYFGVVLSGEKTGKVGEFECLNKGLVCQAVPTEGHEISEYIPEDIKYTSKISVADGSRFIKKLGYLSPVAYLKREKVLPKGAEDLVEISA